MSESTSLLQEQVSPRPGQLLLRMWGGTESHARVWSQAIFWSPGSLLTRSMNGWGPDLVHIPGSVNGYLKSCLTGLRHLPGKSRKIPIFWWRSLQPQPPGQGFVDHSLTPQRTHWLYTMETEPRDHDSLCAVRYWAAQAHHITQV